MAVYQIYAIKYAGPLTSSGAFLMWHKDWEIISKRNYYIWCIKGAGDTVIVDAGVSPMLAKKRNLAGYVNPAELLSRIDVKADEIRHVILTHIHWDHTSGVDIFANARFYVQNEEYRFWLKDPIANRPAFQYVSDSTSQDYLASLEGTNRLVLLNGDQKIFPGIESKNVTGYRGIQLFRRPLNGEIEFITIMWFDSWDAVKQFAGEDYETAVVPPKAREVLSRFDNRSQHYEIREQITY